MALNNFCLRFSIEILKVFSSISTKSTFAPQYFPQFADATKVLEDVQSQSFFFNPKAKQEIWSELVALFEATAYFDLTIEQILSSNFFTVFPELYNQILKP